MEKDRSNRSTVTRFACNKEVDTISSKGLSGFEGPKPPTCEPFVNDARFRVFAGVIDVVVVDAVAVDVVIDRRSVNTPAAATAFPLPAAFNSLERACNRVRLIANLENKLVKECNLCAFTLRVLNVKIPRQGKIPSMTLG